jgi:hypothetical protein
MAGTFKGYASNRKNKSKDRILVRTGNDVSPGPGFGV